MKAENPFYYLPSSQLFPIDGPLAGLDIANSLTAKLKIAKEYTINNSHEEALSVYNELIEEFPNYPFLYACRSILKTRIEEEEGAFYDYQVAKRLDFNYHNALEWINNAGEMVESEELQELIANEKQEEQYYINRATLFVQHFEYQKAIDDFTKAYSLGNNPIVLVSRGAVNMRMVKYNQALSDFNDALKQDNSLMQGYIFRAKLLAAIQEFELADMDFNKAIELSDGDANVYEERAQFYELREIWDLAIADYTTVIELNPEDFYVYVLRADLYEKSNLLQKALEDYNRAIELNPYYSDLYQYRGDIRQSLGDEHGAKEDYAKFEELEEE